jgi:hypothetical protein
MLRSAACKFIAVHAVWAKGKNEGAIPYGLTLELGE